MLPEILLDYLAEVEAAFQTLKTCHFEKYEEEILTSERANLRVRARFVTGHLLEFNEAVTIENNRLTHLSYRYHFQDKNNNLVFRYDNTPHFPNLETFPTHKHLPSGAISSVRPTVGDVVQEVNQYLLLMK
jgi:hypothetical protein